jgi:hypothetical protein
MADMSKLKKGRGLGAPPPLDEASSNLAAPEVAPTLPPQKPSESIMPTSAVPPSMKRRDGRSLRKTHRTVAFATRVTQEFDERVREIAEQTGLKIVEVLEAALAAYERENNAAR